MTRYLKAYRAVSTMQNMKTKPLAKVAVIAKLNTLGYRVAPTDANNPGHYGKVSGWMEAPNGDRVYVNFRDLLAELTPAP